MFSWIEKYPLHFSILSGMKLEDKLNTDLFPRFSICDFEQDYVALYSCPQHTIEFSNKYIYAFMNRFTHYYFHELAHSTSYYNERWKRMNFVKLDQNIVNLEERIADIAAIILVDYFDKPENSMLTVENLDLIETLLKANPTKLALPWAEVELAVLHYFKNKDCNKLQNRLQFFKQVILNNNFTNLNEGLFNEQS